MPPTCESNLVHDRVIAERVNRIRDKVDVFPLVLVIEMTTRCVVGVKAEADQLVKNVPPAGHLGDIPDSG